MTHDREAWLHRNPDALAAVKAGLEQAAAGELVEGPNLALEPVDQEREVASLIAAIGFRFGGELVVKADRPDDGIGWWFLDVRRGEASIAVVELRRGYAGFGVSSPNGDGEYDSWCGVNEILSGIEAVVAWIGEEVNVWRLAEQYRMPRSEVRKMLAVEKGET